MSRAEIVVRKTTLADADDERRDRAYWQTVSPSERLVHVFHLSEEAYAIAGKLPDDPAGRPRSVARVLRA